MQKVRDILEKIFAGHQKDFNIKLWNGHLIEWSREPKFTLVFKDKSSLKRIFLRGDAFTAGTAYIEGALDIEGDVFEAVKLGDYLASLSLGRGDKLKLFAKLITL